MTQQTDTDSTEPTPPAPPGEDAAPATPNDPFATRVSLFMQLRKEGQDERDQAWSVFVERYRPVIAAFARRCGADRQDVDDIVQDVLAAFVGVVGDFVYDRSKGRFRGWLKTCTVRAAVRRAGKNLRFRGVPLDEVSEVETAIEPLWTDIWEQQLVSRALMRLREESGETLAFRVFEQYVLLDRPAAEVAAEFKTTIDTVHQSKTRLTRKLRTLVGALREAEE